MFTVLQSSIDRAMNALKAAGASTPISGKSIEIRDLESAGFAEGESFNLYEKDGAIEIYGRKVAGATNPAPLVLVVMSDGSVRELYLSQLSRSVRKFNHDEGEFATGDDARVRAQGTAVDAWKACGNAETGLAALQGKTIKVTKRQVVHTAFNRPAGLQERDQVVYDFEIVPDAAPAAGGAALA